MSDETLLEKVASRLSKESVSLSEVGNEEAQTVAWSGLATGMLDKEASTKIAGFWSNLTRAEVRALKPQVSAARDRAKEVAEAQTKNYTKTWTGRTRSPEELEVALKKAQKKGKLKKTEEAQSELNALEAALKDARSRANKAAAGTTAGAGALALGVSGGKKLMKAHKERKAYGDYA